MKGLYSKSNLPIYSGGIFLHNCTIMHVCNLKMSLPHHYGSHLLTVPAGWCSLVMGSHTVWQLSTPFRTPQCLLFHTLLWKPRMSDYFDTHHRAGNSSDRQACPLLSDSDLIQDHLHELIFCIGI